MYPWLVTLHLLGLVVFLLAHGVSISVAFRVRGERRRDAVVTLLDLSGRATQVVYVGLALLGVGGLGAAWSAGLLTAPWVVLSYVIVVVTLFAMYAVASPYYHGLRAAIGGTADAPPLDDEALDRRLRTRRPELLATLGGVALVCLVVLMTVKPG
ncbi:MAG TPA: DUF2269 family protein [Candidatus Limnocylindrales bacterium]|nr:DUF2269 family protein [Candidatus Limnocylindrales bacterium]